MGRKLWLFNYNWTNGLRMVEASVRILRTESSRSRDRVAAPKMEESTYLDNVLRERACALCAADRRRVALPIEDACAVCQERRPPEDAVFAVAVGAARRACGPACAEVLLVEDLIGGEACPLCGSRWRAARPVARHCGLCAVPLNLNDGYVGLWRGERLQTFCGPRCLEAYLRRANPFCG